MSARDTASRELTYRTPVQVCPRGCEYRELARRDVVAKTRFWGRADIQVKITFETTNCPLCGARLVHTCTRCGTDVLAPVTERCQHCGLPHPWAEERRAGTERVAVRRWRPGVRGANEPARKVFRAPAGDLWVIEGDITRLEIDAVVSNDDVNGRMWAEVALAIKRAGGEEIERLAREGAPFALGHAWLTRPGALPVDGVIHVASMNRRGESRIEDIEKCLAEALVLARKHDFKSVGIAAIGSGPKAIDPGTWIDSFARVTLDHLLLGRPTVPPAHPISIVLVLYEPVDFEDAVARLRQAVCDVWRSNGAPSHSEPTVRCADTPDDLVRRTLRRLTRRTTGPTRSRR
jgi:O-acetyl-ADP-ribose deacetylase (regulator of RNase III)